MKGSLIVLGLLASAAAAPSIPHSPHEIIEKRSNDGHHGNDKHDGWNGHWMGGDDGHPGKNGGKGDGEGDGKGGGGKNCLVRRSGSPGMSSFYDHGWDHPGHYDGDMDHKGGKGHDGHGGEGGDGGHDGNGGHDDGHHGGHDDCPNPDDAEGTSIWIINNPSVTVNVTFPLRENNGSVLEIVESGVVPMVNRTAPILNSWDLPALKNASTGPATIWGGIISGGMNSTFRPEQGTNQNAGAFRSSMGGLSSRSRSIGSSAARAVAAAKRQTSINAQPIPPPSTTCTYEYQHVLGGDGSPSRGALWALEGFVDLVAADVQQGGIGDCGMGAAIMALASGGWTKYIKNSFVRTGEGEGSYEVLLKKDGVTQRMAIDDQLPVNTPASFACWPYPGFQPVNDAAFPGPNGDYPPTPIFFMPLFEKAFAKFLDANPDWKAQEPDKRVEGYGGLEGINPAYVLAAVTGGTPKSTWRSRPGFDGPILVSLLNCMRGTAPCAISTGNSTLLEGLGTPDSTGTIWLNPAGDGAVPKGYTPGDTSGMAASDAPGSKSTFTIIDFDQVIKTPNGDRSTALTFVGNHAYGFDHSRSTDFPFPNSISSLIDARMSVLNPWGSNPCQWPGGGCGGGKGAFDEPSEVPFSFRTLAQSIVAVFTVENMPAL